VGGQRNAFAFAFKSTEYQGVLLVHARNT